MKRNTHDDKELARASAQLIDGTEGRIECLEFADIHQIGICFSWWDGNRMMPRPLDGTDAEFSLLFKNALTKKVFSESFLTALREMLPNAKRYGGTTPPKLRDTDYATELERVSINLSDGSEARLERLRFKQNVYAGKEGIRFSWWADNRFQIKPLGITEKELLLLLGKALQRGIFSDSFIVG